MSEFDTYPLEEEEVDAAEEFAVVIAADQRQRVRVSLVGQAYQVAPPKGALALSLGVQARAADKSKNPEAIWKVLQVWVEKAFTKEEAKQIHARMMDPDDSLDFEHIMKLMEALAEKFSANPTS